MTNPFGQIKSGGTTYFKPADHMNDLAIIVEAKKIEREVPSEFKGQTRYRDEVTADLSIFKNNEQLENGTPEVVKNAKLVHKGLTEAVEESIGQPVVVRLDKVPTKAGSMYVFRTLDSQEHIDQAGAYYVKHTEEIASALENVPSFD